MRKNKINWKPLCKWGIISGILAMLITWLTIFLNNNTSLDECQFIQYIILIFNIPTFILLTIIFGPLGDRVPSLFQERENQIIIKIVMCACAFITYFFIGVLIKIIYNKTKNKNKKMRNNISLKK